MPSALATTRQLHRRRYFSRFLRARALPHSRCNGRSVTAGSTSSGNSSNGLPHTIRHLEGANYVYADGHVKWGRHIKGITLTGSGMANSTISDQGPPKKDIDYDCDEIVGDNAGQGTAGVWD